MEPITCEGCRWWGPVAASVREDNFWNTGAPLEYDIRECRFRYVHPLVHADGRNRAEVLSGPLFSCIHAEPKGQTPLPPSMLDKGEP